MINNTLNNSSSKLLDSQKQEKYKYYLRETSKLEDWYGKTSMNLDKLIFGLATGTIVLSVTLIDKITGLQNIKEVVFLKTSWFLM